MKRKRLDPLGQDGGSADFDTQSTAARARAPGPRTADVLVIGGGPAGASAARLLARWGYEVILVDAGPAEDRRLWETLPPSCRKPLTALGVLATFDAAGFDTSVGNRVAWAGEPVRDVDFAGGGIGWQVERSELARVLVASATAAGVTAIRGMARSALRDPDGGWLVEWDGPEAGSAHVGWVLDGSGRAGVVARGGMRRRAPGPATLALIGEWGQVGDEELGRGGRTLVESYADGWAWSIPTRGRQRMIAAIVDPRASGIRRGEGVEEIYRAQLARTEHHRRSIADASLLSRVWGCTTTPYEARHYAEKGCLLIGDAGSFLDPLSSFGVKKALASAWLAAVVVNTALRSAADTEAALQLFNERETRSRTAYASKASEFYRNAAAYHGTPFWTARSGKTPNEPIDAGLDEPTSESLLRHPGLPEALGRMREATRLIVNTAGFRTADRPLVEGDLVVRRSHIIPASTEAPIRTVGGIELPELVRLAGNHDQVPDLLEAFRDTGRAAELPAFLSALGLLVALNVIRPIRD